MILFDLFFSLFVEFNFDK